MLPEGNRSLYYVVDNVSRAMIICVELNHVRVRNTEGQVPDTTEGPRKETEVFAISPSTSFIGWAIGVCSVRLDFVDLETPGAVMRPFVHSTVDERQKILKFTLLTCRSQIPDFPRIDSREDQFVEGAISLNVPALNY